MPPDGELACFVAGFVAAEGSFNRSGRKFRFAIALADIDYGMCDAAKAVLGVGHLYRYPRRQPHFHDEAVFVVQSAEELVHHVVPFMDAYLPYSKKRDQYISWRSALVDFWNNEIKRRRACTIDGCSALQRAKNVCRRHYYLIYRR